MKRENKLIITVILFAILLMGIGYASLANNILSINGEVTATANQDNFKVHFTGEVPSTYTSETYITIEATPIALSQNATVNILGLNKKGDAGYAILEVENASNDIDAEITVATEIADSEMFDIDVIMCDLEGTAINDFSVASGQKTYVKIFAELLKTPTEIQKATISAKITAVPKDTTQVPDIPEVPDNPVQTDIFAPYYAKAEEKLQTLTLDQKIAQLFVIGTSARTNYTTLDTYQFGGHLYLLDSFTGKSISQIKEIIKTSQATSNIPLLVSIDEEGETVSRLNSTNLSMELGIEKFKNSSTLYENGGFDAIKQDTINKSRILLSLGFNLNFAPLVDIAEPTAYIYNRTLKQNAELTSTFARTVIEASKNSGVTYSLKHYPGYGNSTDTHAGYASDSRPLEEFEAKDLLPFKAGIKSGAEMVMVTHNVVKCFDENNPASLSKNAHNYLRNNLNFTGVIITDAINMGAITSNYSTKDAIIKALSAGNDLICLVMDEGTKDPYTQESLTYAGVIKYVSDAISAGQLSEELVNNSVKRILALKYYKGLMN